jgi:hypothetical protein
MKLALAGNSFILATDGVNTRSLGFARDDRVGEGARFGDVFAWSVLGVGSSALGGRI